MMDIDEVFEKFIVRKKGKYGFQIDCVKGLWGVTAPTEEMAENEARYYFIQYFSDGEYDS